MDWKRGDRSCSLAHREDYPKTRVPFHHALISFRSAFQRHGFDHRATGVRTLYFSVASAVDGSPVSEPLAVTFLKIRSAAETSILSSPTPKAMRVPPGFIPARAGAAAL